MTPPDTSFDDCERERVRRAADRLDEALQELGPVPGAPAVQRARELLLGIGGVDPVPDDGGAADRLRDPSAQLTAGRRALARRRG